MSGRCPGTRTFECGRLPCGCSCTIFRYAMSLIVPNGVWDCYTSPLSARVTGDNHIHGANTAVAHTRFRICLAQWSQGWNSAPVTISSTSTSDALLHTTTVTNDINAVGYSSGTVHAYNNWTRFWVHNIPTSLKPSSGHQLTLKKPTIPSPSADPHAGTDCVE